MFHDTTSVDLRLQDLQATAAELRAERAATSRVQADQPRRFRVTAGETFLAMGTALVNSTSQARISPVGR